MEKQFNRFSATVPEDFAELMIGFWMEEGFSRNEAIDAYYDDDFIELVDRIKGQRCKFKPDLGYADRNINGTLCFEVEDDNFVIPVLILN